MFIAIQKNVFSADSSHGDFTVQHVFSFTNPVTVSVNACLVSLLWRSDICPWDKCQLPAPRLAGILCSANLQCSEPKNFSGKSILPLNADTVVLISHPRCTMLLNAPSGTNFSYHLATWNPSVWVTDTSGNSHFVYGWMMESSLWSSPRAAGAHMYKDSRDQFIQFIDALNNTGCVAQGQGYRASCVTQYALQPWPVIEHPALASDLDTWIRLLYLSHRATHPKHIHHVVCNLHPLFVKFYPPWAVTVHKSQRSYTTENRLEGKEYSLWPDFCYSFSCCISQRSPFSSRSWVGEWMKKLSGKFLRLRLEDLAHRYQGS